MSSEFDFNKSLDRAFDALSEALEAADAVQASGAKIHPSIGNRLSTAKLILAEILADISKTQEHEPAVSVPDSPEINTKINYLYRDADNYKVWNNCVIRGVLTAEQQKAILECLDEGENFIPHIVGLPEVTFEDLGYSYDPDVDHDWFEMYSDSFETTRERPTVDITPDALVAAFTKCKGNWVSIAASLNAETVPVQQPACQEQTAELTGASLVKPWYLAAYPTDEMGHDIQPNLTFDQVYKSLENGTFVDGIYKAWDSVIRERVFEKLAKIKNVPYDHIYSIWLNDGKADLSVNGKKPKIEFLIQSAEAKAAGSTKQMEPPEKNPFHLR